MAEPEVMSPDLARAVEALYAACGVRCVSAGLEVCLCPVCMTEQTRLKLTRSLNTDLPEDLIREYSNSAHAMPAHLDDLVVLLPRYADLMSCEISVDYMDSDEILWRFGGLYRSDAMTSLQRAAYESWGNALFAAMCRADAQDEESIASVYTALKLLLSGGRQGEAVISLLKRALAEPDIGPSVTASLAAHVVSTRKGAARLVPLTFIWTGGPADGAVQAVQAWLESPEFDAALARAMTSDLGDSARLTCKIARDALAAR